jgi:hypothetical protein
LTLIPKDKVGGQLPAADKGSDRGRGLLKGKKDGTKAGRDEADEDNDQPELPIVKDHATRGVSLCIRLFNVGYKMISLVCGLLKAHSYLIFNFVVAFTVLIVSHVLSGLFTCSGSSVRTITMFSPICRSR